MSSESVRGRLLVATPSLRSPEFRRAVVAVLEHNDDGALGVVLNRPGPTPLADVVPEVAPMGTDPAVLFHGGPVERAAAIALGVAPDPAAESAGWQRLTGWLVSVDLSADPVVLQASLSLLRVFAGYAGWGPGQLEGEILTGSWYVVDALPGDVFVTEPARLWPAVLRRQPWPLSAVATFPSDPTLN